MRVLGWLVRLGLALGWAVMALVAALVLLVCWPFVRAPRRHAVDVTGKPFPDIRYQRDLGDEQDPLESSKDIVTEGLGHWEHSAILVLDGMLLTLGDLHPNDQDVFGPARRPQ